MISSIFNICYFIGLIVGSIIRGVYARQYKQNRIKDARKAGPDRLLMFLPFLGMFAIPLFYVLTPWLDFADYHVPTWAGWTGAVVFAVALWLLERSHVDLGRNFSPALEIMEGHSLVTHGVYRRIRHPMYAAHWLWGIAQALLLQNWIAGFAMLVSLLPLYLVRVPREEQMMVGGVIGLIGGPIGVILGGIVGGLIGNGVEAETAIAREPPLELQLRLCNEEGISPKIYVVVS